MATLVDSLIIALKLDPSDFSRGQKQAAAEFLKTRDAAKKTADEIEKDAKNASQFIGKLRNEVIGLLAAFTAGKGIKEFTSDLTSSDAATGRLAKTLNMTVSELSAWQGAAKLSGGTAEGIAGSFQGLTQELQRFSLTGESSAIPYFRALGISIVDNSGKIKQASAIYLELADRFSKMDPARAATFGAALGMDQGTINLLIQGRGAVQAYLAEAQKAGTANAQSAASAQALQRAWNHLTQASENLGRIIFVNLAPALVRLLNALSRLAEWAQQHPRLMEALFLGLAAAIAAFTAVLTAGAFSAALGALGTLGTLGAGTGLSALAVGIRAVAAAIGLLGVAAQAVPLVAIGSALGYVGYQVYKNWDKIGWAKNANGGRGDQFAPGSPQARMQAQDDKQRFVEMGWTPEQAAGIVANIQRESGGRGNAIGDNGQAFGLAQWHPDRQADFKARFGHDIRDSTRAEQLAFIDWELRHGKEKSAGKALMAAKNAADAARVLSDQYERPANRTGEANARAAIAQALMNNPTAATGLPGYAQAAQTTAGDSLISNRTNTVQTHIGEVTVHTQATDAAGIARDLPAALRNTSFAAQANYGLD